MNKEIREEEKLKKENKKKITALSIFYLFMYNDKLFYQIFFFLKELSRTKENTASPEELQAQQF